MARRYEKLSNVVRLLREEREARGVSLSELADLTGISKSSLSRLENERSDNPTMQTLMRIADALGIELTIRFSKPEKAA